MFFETRSCLIHDLSGSSKTSPAAQTHTTHHTPPPGYMPQSAAAVGSRDPGFRCGMSAYQGCAACPRGRRRFAHCVPDLSAVRRPAEKRPIQQFRTYSSRMSIADQIAVPETLEPRASEAPLL